jgi:AcrR family transcriptional regulator
VIKAINRQSSLKRPAPLVPNVVERRSPDETRACILQVAWDLIRQLGARATIADVADRLGMSSANVYRFYPSKQALSEAVASSQLGAIIAEGRRIAAGPGSASERFGAVLLMMYHCMRDQMVNQSRVHEVVDIAMSERWPAIEVFKQDCGAIVAGLVAEGQQRGEFGPGDPQYLAAQTLGACACIHHPQLIAQNGDSPTALPPEAVVEFALRALTHPGPFPPNAGA